jgi:hypothetical protein
MQQEQQQQHQQQQETRAQWSTPATMTITPDPCT